MGYDTWFNINTSSEPQDYREEEAVRKEISNAVFGTDRHNVIEGFEAHWYDHGKDLIKISKKHPTVLIEISGNGEDNDDIWAARYRDGKSETIRFEGLPDFKEILSSQEEEDVFRKASEAYHEVLDNLTKAAVRRIRTIKERITGAPDRFLWLNRLNDHCPQLVIADSLPLSNREYVPLLVTGIHDDGETLSTEQDPVDMRDMLPDDIKGLMNLLEGYVEEIAKGTVKGRWNDDEEWYELYYPAYEEN